MFHPLLLHIVTGTLPADNGGVSTFAIGDLFPGGSVLCTKFVNGTAVDNYTLPIGPEVDGATLIVLALQPTDLFSQNMAGANSSLDAFLHSDAVGLRAVGATSYLFLAYGLTDSDAAATTAALRMRMAARLAATKQTLDTLSRIHFGAQRAGSVAGLGAVLEQWTTPITSLRVTVVTAVTVY